MSGKPDNDPWISDARALLDASARQLDDATVARLARARRAALDLPRAPRWTARWRSWGLPLAGLAAACAILVALNPGHPRRADVGSGAQPPVASGVEIEAGASDEIIDLYQDLEFYAWLDVREDTGG